MKNNIDIIDYLLTNQEVRFRLKKKNNLTKEEKIELNLTCFKTICIRCNNKYICSKYNDKYTEPCIYFIT